MKAFPILAGAAIVLVTTAALGAPLPVSTFAPDKGGQISFTTPSDNIECVYTPTGGGATYVPEDGGPELSCDRLAPAYLRFVLSAKRPAAIITDVGDQGCCGDENPLPYATQWHEAPFTCVSMTSGLSCKREDGHGFFISRAKVSSY